VTRRRSSRAWRRSGRFTRRERRALAVLIIAGGVPLALWGELHTLIGPGWAGYLAGVVSGAAAVVLAARPRLDVRVRLRGGTGATRRAAARGASGAAASGNAGGTPRGRRTP
jgi:hypothetical protein